MKRVNEIRSIISKIPYIFYEIESEETDLGEEYGVKTLWDDYKLKPIQENYLALAPDEKEEVEKTLSSPLQIEEIFEYGASIDKNILIRALKGKKGDQIKKSIQLKGTDALAYYVSFHTKGAQWGIYIPISSIVYMICEVFYEINTDFWTEFKIAFRALHQHELFHFATDYMAAQWEAITGKPCKTIANKKLKDPVYKYNILEEKIANAWMIRSFWGGKTSLKVDGKTLALRNFVKQQPLGYSEGGEITNSKIFFESSEKLSMKYISCINNYDSQFHNALNLNTIYPIYPNIDWRYCPIHILTDEERLNIPPIYFDLFRCVSILKETLHFKKELSKFPDYIQKKWIKVKNILTKTTTIKGIDFKLWKRMKDIRIFSVKLDRKIRAHLEYSDINKTWTAIEIGGHTKMGHG